jgi:16S rRNA (cytidine1402-2'-O)-methyltransferase
MPFVNSFLFSFPWESRFPLNRCHRDGILGFIPIAVHRSESVGFAQIGRTPKKSDQRKAGRFLRHERIEDSMDRPRGTLYVVSTPIGNPEDITLRAIRTLKEVDLIAAEDTRRTGLLLKHFGIEKPLTSYFEGNEMKKREFILSRLMESTDIALVSDAGTPGISDPGFRLIRLAIENEVPVIPVPGPSAVITALSIAGLPTDAFFFKGFLPHKPKKRRDLLEELKETRETLIFYESPHRIDETLWDISEILGDREIALAREMTKAYEEVMRGKVSEIRRRIGERKLKGEITLIVSGKTRK